MKIKITKGGAEVIEPLSHREIKRIDWLEADRFKDWWRLRRINGEGVTVRAGNYIASRAGSPLFLDENGDYLFNISFIRLAEPRRINFEMYINPLLIIEGIKRVLHPLNPRFAIIGKRRVTGAIKSIGAELEGGWVTPPPSLYGDNSVECLGYTGEVSSHFERLSDLLAWVKSSYPAYYNYTCGLHLHFLIDKYPLLASWDFWNYFREQTEALANDGFGQIKNRFNNKYCRAFPDNIFKFYYIVQEQMYLDYKQSLRYYALNYCYRMHGTLECRLLPMIRKEKALSLINYIFNIFHDYLNRGIEDEEWEVVV